MCGAHTGKYFIDSSAFFQSYSASTSTLDTLCDANSRALNNFRFLHPYHCGLDHQQTLPKNGILVKLNCLCEAPTTLKIY
ncbi:hypothetical protein X798_02619 [Onchocerca flexuosa]|uniref:Uncharacterized protein n=1 Tax=Onchocerca flexuosa TaxID=387005 RepID=A0A238BYH3_9BILA|nr:hypothetical protein X798_02619 [Onchocerca flexuosa]